jgi:hypothetical protein
MVLLNVGEEVYIKVTKNIDQKLKLQDNINNQNLGLWNELNSQFDFRLIYSENEISWRVNSEKRPIEIYTSSKTANIPSFTHELLHVYIEAKGMSTDKELLNCIYGTDSFQILTNNALFATIHNYCSHTKMFPYFVKMGFDESLFIADRIKFSRISYLILRIMFLFKKTRHLAVTDFIGHSMALFNDNESANKNNTRKSLNKLKKLNPSLFKIIEDFNIRWRNSIDLNLTFYFQEFDNKLDEWLIENRIL